MITEDNLPKEIKNNCPGIYVGHYTLKDIYTDYISRGPTKIGRAKHLDAIFRGRNQGGADFIIDAFYPCLNYVKLEKDIHFTMQYHRLSHPRRKELYSSAPEVMSDLIEGAFRLKRYVPGDPVNVNEYK